MCVKSIHTYWMYIILTNNYAYRILYNVTIFDNIGNIECLATSKHRASVNHLSIGSPGDGVWHSQHSLIQSRRNKRETKIISNIGNSFPLGFPFVLHHPLIAEVRRHDRAKTRLNKKEMILHVASEQSATGGDVTRRIFLYGGGRSPCGTVWQSGRGNEERNYRKGRRWRQVCIRPPPEVDLSNVPCLPAHNLCRRQHSVCTFKITSANVYKPWNWKSAANGAREKTIVTRGPL